jgi:D-xylulose kinase
VNMKLLLGIDAGTTSVKSGLFNADGQCLAVARQEYQFSTPRASWAELNPEIYWQACVSTTQKVLQQTGAKDVSAVSVSSQGETMIALDAFGKPVYPAIVWLDNRAEREADILAKKFAAEVYERTGIPEIIPTWTACKILWLKQNEPDAFSRVNKFMLVQDYLIYRLTGEYTTNDSVSCTSLYFDITKGRWWDAVLREIGIGEKNLPHLVPPGEVIGNVSADASAQTGLSQTTKVVGGGMDQSVGAIGAGNIRAGVVSETTGAALTIQVTIPSPDVDKHKVIPVYCHSVPGEYLFVPVCPTAGMAYKWFRDTFAGLEVAQAEKERTDSYDMLSALAADVPPGSDGLVMLPHLMGAYSPDPNFAARGSFTGFTLSHTRGHFARAILEGVAFLLKRNIEVLQNAGVHITEIRSTGGGARSPLWNQIKSSVCGLPVVTLQNEDTALLGDAILAGVVAGVFQTIEDGCTQMVALKDKIVPDFQAEDYVASYQRYCDLDQTLNDYYRRQYKNP